MGVVVHLEKPDAHRQQQRHGAGQSRFAQPVEYGAWPGSLLSHAGAQARIEIRRGFGRLPLIEQRHGLNQLRQPLGAGRALVQVPPHRRRRGRA